MPAKRKYLKGDPRAQFHDEDQSAQEGQDAQDWPTDQSGDSRRDRRQHGGQGSRERRRQRRAQERAQTAGESFQGAPATTLRPEDELRAQVRQASDDFRKTLRTSRMFGPNSTRVSDAKQLTHAHRKYQGMMVMAVLQPLEHGLDLTNIVRSVTLARVMWAYAPEFREQVSMAAEGLFDQLDGQIMRRVVDMKKRGAPGADYLDSHWNRIRSLREGDRVPFTASSAGLAEVGLLERAYDALREPDADRDSILDSYRDAVGKLYAMAEHDGVAPEDVSRSARLVGGQMIRDDPACAAMFDETAYGDFRMVPDRVATTPQGRTIRYWDGGFRHHTGTVVDSGTFGPRMPMSVEQHQARMARAIARDMTEGDVGHLHASMMTYGMSWGSVPREAVRRHPGLNEDVRQRFDDTARFVRAMREDGVDPGEAQLAYTNAFMDALSIVEETHPSLAAQWEARYGQDWSADIHAMLRDPQGANGIWERIDQQMRDEASSSAGNRGTYANTDHGRSDGREDRDASREYTTPGHEGQSDPASGPASSQERDRRRRNASRPSETASRAARNQRYNEAETGGFMGLGADDADLMTPGHERPSDDEGPQMGD